MWSVEYEYIAAWLDNQDDKTVAGIFAALELLEQQGPTLGRPLVDTITGAQVNNLKELRPTSPRSTEVRILFVFDPKRKAIMLLGGDKSKGKNGRAKWSGWYKEAVPQAEEIYRRHLNALGENNG